MNKLSTNNSILFKKIFESMKDIIETSLLKFDIDGLHVQAMDTSHVILCSIFINKDFFNEYTFTQFKAIGISIKNLCAVLKGTAVEDTISFILGADSDKLLIQLQSHGRKSKYELNLMTIEEESNELPEFEFDLKISLDSPYFVKLLKELTIDQSFITIDFTFNNGNLELVSSGDIGTAEITLSGDNLTFIEKNNDNFKVSMALNYLCTIIKNSAVSSSIIIGLKERTPIMLKYEFEESYVCFYMAPKMED